VYGIIREYGAHSSPHLAAPRGGTRRSLLAGQIIRNDDGADNSHLEQFASHSCAEAKQIDVQAMPGLEPIVD